MQLKLSTVEIKPKFEHRYSVIWLHGLGADGHDFEGIVPQLSLINIDYIHFLFPNAPVRSVTVNGGMRMRAWYDIADMSLSRIDASGINESSGLIAALIEQEIDSGIPARNILLAGFSQGGAIALHCGLRYSKQLAGIVALSTYMPTADQIKAERSEVNYGIPIMMAHGILDSVVAIELAKKAYYELVGLHYPVEWHDFMMDHAVCPDEIGRISAFINSRFDDALH